MVGRYRGVPMVGLLGNPVSTLVCSLLFLKQALERLSGLPDNGEQPVTARLGRRPDAAARATRGRQEQERDLLAPVGPAAAGGGGPLEVVPFEVQDSSMMRP